MEEKIFVYGRDNELYYLFKDAIKSELMDGNRTT